MRTSDIYAFIDHTYLKQQAVWNDIKLLCDDAMKHQTASVCIPPCFVLRAKEYTNGKLPICTVIGFPNGNMTAKTKVFETADAIANGADEIDMVINIGEVKERNEAGILLEINAIKEACKDRLLKVIIETCLLDESDKIFACEVVSKSNADFIKTSTGFSNGGATLDDVKLLRKYCVGKKVKAAGGIKSVDDAKAFIQAGADRLGTSSLVKMLEECEND